MRRGGVLAVVAAMVVASITLWAYDAMAQSASEIQTMKKDIDALKAGQSAIQKDLQEIKALLLRSRPVVAAPAAPPPPPHEATVNIEGAPFKGKKDAKVTLVDFTDYQ
jgi:hypothetical protein